MPEAREKKPVTVHYAGQNDGTTFCGVTFQNKPQQHDDKKIWWVIKDKPLSKDQVNCQECMRLCREEKRLATTPKTTRVTEEAVA